MKNKLIMILFLILPGCNLFGILGPADNPGFQNKTWNEIKITYWVNEKGNRLPRTVSINNQEVISQIANLIELKKISGLSVGCTDQLIFRESNGEVWQGDIVFEDAIDLCKQKDMYYSYRLYLADYRLYKALLEACVNNELQYHQNAKAENIILRRNLKKDYPPVE